MTEAPRWWVEALRAALEDAGGAASSSAETFAARVPGGYIERTAPAVAAADLLECQRLADDLGERPVRMAVQPDPDPGAGMFRFRLYGRGAMELSSFMPILESFGLTVVEAVPHLIQTPDGGKAQHLDDFGLRARSRGPFDPSADGDRLVAAVEAAWRGQAEVDSLNRLVVGARLDWRQVVVLRAYRRYRRQVGTRWSDRQLDDPLVEFPAVAVALLAYFGARFDPARPNDDDDGGGDDDEVISARAAVLAALTSVDRLEPDQVLRGYLGLVDATVRTSHYARTATGGYLPTLALKLDAARVPELPPPRPLVETFVYAPRVEGIHLRGGLIARGGIRWSDRHDDLRTEVLGLARAQVLKNAGIVPTGAKGGYVCKRLATPEGAECDVHDEVRECYRLFVSSLLDVTDNVVEGRVVAPAGVRTRDGEDSYLVVAADRGTATFSDLANQISAEHRFWLGDAFASGGRHGYDHKAMGITARGAWVAARQHFRQLGIDPERDEIRVLGVGDMSGDVFGNGMLLSRTMKLVAAFDHRHIFVDPDPDPARSYSARTALFEAPGSSWQDYDRSALSPGGGVWSRTAKEIALSPEARAAVGLTASVVSPPELVSAILTASADLLWLGGIGTFVKAPGEAHAEVGDRTNDVVRVNADQVRARVVAEGGNLGFTQKARIVYSRRGGKINTDFIDNAAGVATSDYEVNLKILLAAAIEQGRLGHEARDDLLAQVGGDVAASVLHDVGLTARAVTRAVPASAADLDAYDALMADLEAAGRLDREVESLPAGEDLARRRAAGAGLTRPEAAVVLALAKADLADALEASPLVADPAIGDAVTSYFPAPVVARFPDLLTGHRLYLQLVATRVAHEIVDRMGVTWAHETAAELGVAVADVGRAFWAARHVLGAEARWREVEAMAATVEPEAEDVLDLVVADAVQRLARHYLRAAAAAGPAARFDPADDRAVAEVLDATAINGYGNAESRMKTLVELGVEPASAAIFARLPTVALAGEVASVQRALASVGARTVDAAGVVAAFEAFDTAVGITGFREALSRLALSSRWGRWQVRRLEDDLADLRRHAVQAALGIAGAESPTAPGVATGTQGSAVGGTAGGVPGGVAGDGDPGAAVLAWLAARPGPTARFRRLAAQLGEPQADGQSLAALAVRALSELRTAG